jgi:hypothetical protein
MSSLKIPNFEKKLKKISDGKRLLLILHYCPIKKTDFCIKIGILPNHLTRLYELDIIPPDVLVKITKALEITEAEWYSIGLENDALKPEISALPPQTVEEALIQYAALMSYFLKEIAELKAENARLRVESKK